MPQDLRRNNGPEASVAYRYHSKLNLRTGLEKLAEAFDAATGRRADGRQPDEARKIFIKSNLISQAKGSAYIELGHTKVIVSVFDPREIPKQTGYSINGELYCDFKFAPFSGTCRRHPQTDDQEKSLAASMKRALESAVCRHEFPNFQVDIFAHVLQDDGGVLAAAITAAGLALADAGIPMYDVITAATVGRVAGRQLMDPTAAEEELCAMGVTEVDGGEQTRSVEHGLVTMARLSTLDQVSELWQSGSFRMATQRAVTAQLAQRNRDMVPVVQQILVRKVLASVEEEEALTLQAAELRLGGDEDEATAVAVK